MIYPSQAYLKECISYNAESGEIFWNKRPRSHFMSDKAFKIFTNQKSNKPAGSSSLLSGCGKTYKSITIDKVRYLQHRIAWLYVHGSIDDAYEIDHINGNGIDNRIENLRIVDRQGNAKNHRKQKNNRSGIVGVCFNKRRNKWMSFINNGDKVKITIGYFDDIELAKKARKDAEIKFGYHRNHGKERPL